MAPIVHHEVVMTMTTERKNIERLLSTLDKFDTAMLVTHGASGELHARPMVISDVGRDGQLWFVTTDEAPKVTEVEEDARTVAIMQTHEVYVSVSGHLRRQTDPDVVSAHLNERARGWLDPTMGDPMALMLAPLHAEIWDCSVNQHVRTAVRMALKRNNAAAPQLEEPASLVKHVVIPFPPA